MSFIEGLFLATVFGGALGAALLWASGMIRYVPNDKVGILERVFSFKGSVPDGFIALEGEAGFDPAVLRGGWHLFFPFQVRVHRMPLVTVPQGTIGYVFARDGRPLAPDQALGRNAADEDFQDVRAFFSRDGQRGPQRRVLREGTYAINLAQFAVFTEGRVYALPLAPNDRPMFEEMSRRIQERDGFRPILIQGGDDGIGVVTVHDGPALESGEIIAPTVEGHDNFQDPERFLAAGGRRGRQLQVLAEGTWILNRLFATVERVPKTVVEVGYVGVVVSYTGNVGSDVSGHDYKHGELVEVGERGVWRTALLPGKYAFNTYAGNVILVPTTNFILKWTKAEVGSHRFDENLTEVSLITRDAFEPHLPLSVVVHIDYRKAPLVIQRFGDVKRLVEQTLDPMVSAYFKNVTQTRTLIELIHDRSEIQDRSSEEMREKFIKYNLELEEVLIGTPGSDAGDDAIERILGQIRARQLADEQVETYSRQQKAAVQERELREAEAKAEQQKRITTSEMGIVVEGNEGKAAYQRAVQQAAQIRTLAEADAEKIARIGIAQALATEEQIRAWGGPRYQVMQQVLNRFAEAVEKGGIEVVPRVMVGNAGGNAFESLLTVLMSQTLDATEGSAPASEAALAMREALKTQIAKAAHPS